MLLSFSKPESFVEKDFLRSFDADFLPPLQWLLKDGVRRDPLEGYMQEGPGLEALTTDQDKVLRSRDIDLVLNDDDIVKLILDDLNVPKSDEHNESSSMPQNLCPRYQDPFRRLRGRWRLLFRTKDYFLRKIAAWVRILDLPLELYNNKFLWQVGAYLGSMLKIDPYTSLLSRWKFARICIEIDLKKKLVPAFRVLGQEFKIKYESLHLICFSYGKYGHRQEQCVDMTRNNHPDLGNERTNTNNLHKCEDNIEGKSRLSKDMDLNNHVNGDENQESQFGPWMLAKKQFRKKLNSSSSIEPIVKYGKSKDLILGSRYNVLDTNVEDQSLVLGVSQKKISEGYPSKALTSKDLAANKRIGKSVNHIKLGDQAKKGPRGKIISSWAKSAPEEEGGGCSGMTTTTSNSHEFCNNGSSQDNMAASRLMSTFAKGLQDNKNLRYSIQDIIGLNSDSLWRGRDHLAHIPPDKPPDPPLLMELDNSSNDDNKKANPIGNFNSILFENEKFGGRPANLNLMRQFADCLNFCGLQDLGFKGSPFTWQRSNIKEMIDKVVVNDSWRMLFQNSFLIHLPIPKFDHVALWLRIKNKDSWVPKPKPFKFLTPWLFHMDFNIQERRLLNRIQGIHCKLSFQDNPFLNNLMLSLWKEYQEIMNYEEVFWAHQYKSNWLRLGDRNNRFFHRAVINRRFANQISTLRNKDNYLKFDPLKLQDLAVRYFRNLFTDHNPYRCSLYIVSRFPILRAEDNLVLNVDLSLNEIKVALFSIGNMKAPDPDGLHALFFKNQWEVLALFICKFVSDIFDNPSNIASVNDTAINLISKINNPDSLKQFKPIFLCNVSYKIITKLLANRIRGTLPHIISARQTSFIPGRQGIDNTIILQELLHSINTLKASSRFMVIKIDLEKAYDRLRWQFIADTLKNIGFS
ncbi:uncharacterized protein LOC113850972 [Abrus precatorius]|uniref:Uncharacterized protein LOC113850972 n=1 Tax=Abrus precatorius TaxID=3816 RepID=A0A8B8K2N0_ABRPR|nr:uncharacterized protein LOC113850972 [Abrus precatorius]